MESVWWVFKTIWDKNLVYKSHRVMPYSTACNTPLSNFEAGLNYKEETVDPAVVVSFPKLDEPGTSFIAWTTTPWTLPSNLALCVNPEMKYIRLKDLKTGNIYIMAESRISQLYPKAGRKDYKGGEFEVVSTCLGSELVGSKYEPLFPYFVEQYKNTAFRVVADAYVTDDAGTGVVHQAPAFGEDDNRVCAEQGIFNKTSGELPCPVDPNGRFTDEVPHFKGQYVKAADDGICAMLKEQGRLVQKGSIKHSYPFCWRSDTPLIYRAVPSWFVNVESIKERLLANNEETYWVPGTIKEKRFHNWLRDARDWNVSRNRYWGTPIPIWMSDDGEEIVVIGSIKELEDLSGCKITDLHREYIDKVEVPSKRGKGMLRRVDEVFDCWFESGSMPYAQIHYPFENSENFDKKFPADFIAEGLDQTRGWFYTLMVLSTALFDKPAFKNLIVNGLVLAEDGKKMSKRLKNYPDPLEVVESYGADALRLYLINSPVVRAEPLRFKEKGVLSVVKDVFLPWYNALRFFSQNASRFNSTTGVKFVPNDKKVVASQNAMDKWITAATQELITFTRQEMGGYRLYTVVPRLVQFINDLTNWYVRLNRRRLKGAEGAEETERALNVLYFVLAEVSALMAPFTPFLTETMYQYMRAYHPNFNKSDADPTAFGSAESVHFLSIPNVRSELVDEACVVRTERMQSVIELGRIARERRVISLKTPVKNIVVVHPDQSVLDDISLLTHYIRDELNALDVVLTSNESEWATLTAQANPSLLGKRLGKDLRAVSTAVSNLSDAEVKEFLAKGTITVAGHVLNNDEIKVVRTVQADKVAEYETIVSPDGKMLVALNTTTDAALQGMGAARQVINRVQKLRKESGVLPDDNIFVSYKVVPASEATYAKWEANEIDEDSDSVAGDLAGDEKKDPVKEEIDVSQPRFAAYKTLKEALLANHATMRDTIAKPLVSPSFFDVSKFTGQHIVTRAFVVSGAIVYIAIYKSNFLLTSQDNLSNALSSSNLDAFSMRALETAIAEASYDSNHSGNSLSLNVNGSTINLEKGVHYYTTPEAYLLANTPIAEDPLPDSMKDVFAKYA